MVTCYVPPGRSRTYCGLSQVKAGLCSNTPHDVDCFSCLEGIRAQAMEDALDSGAIIISGRQAPTISLPQGVDGVTCKLALKISVTTA